MKKIVLLFIIVIFMFLGIEINAANGQNYFVQSINTVSFANETYTVLYLKDYEETIYSYVYDDAKEYVGIEEDTVTYTMSGAQIQFSDLYNHFDEIYYDLQSYYVYNSNMINASSNQNYAFEWYYTFSEPSYVIVSVQNNGWFQVASVPVGSIYFSIVYGSLTGYEVDNYVAYYDINGSIIPNTSAWFSGNGSSDNRVGFAFLPLSNSDYNMGYLAGYNQGYYDGNAYGYNDGVVDGYNSAKETYGISYEDQWLTASEWGAIRYNEGLEQDLYGDLYDVFEALIVFIGSIFSTNIFPGVSFGLLWSIPIAFNIFKWVVKKFGGS